MILCGLWLQAVVEVSSCVNLACKKWATTASHCRIRIASFIHFGNHGLRIQLNVSGRINFDVKVHIELVVLILTKAPICTAPWPSLLARTCLSSITCFKETTAKAGMGLSYLHWATIMQHPRSHVADVLHVYQGYWSGAFYRAMKVYVHNSSESVKQIVNENM